MSGIDILSYKLGQKSAGGGSGGSVRLQNKTFNANGTYKADAGYDGLGTVTVDVAGSGGSDEDWIIGDGNTHLWISLQEGRTSPMLGVGVNGTVTVDWGDGSTPDVLTGTRTYPVAWTPNHEYAAAGDYVITLTVDGEMALYGGQNDYDYSYILRHSSESDRRNPVYQNALKKVEIGNGETKIETCAFSSCVNLTSVAIPISVTSIGAYAFQNCYNLANFTIPNSVTSIRFNAFAGCYGFVSIAIPDGVTKIENFAFALCYRLTSVVIPNSVTSIGSSAFENCRSLASIAMPGSVTSIGANAFTGCGGVKSYDFTNHTTVPTLGSTSAFSNIPADCEIRVPAALVDEWKAATNWSTYAANIVGV